MRRLVQAAAVLGGLALVALAPSGAVGAPRPERRAVLVLRLEAPKALGGDLVSKLDQAVRQEIAGAKQSLKLLPPPALDLASMELAAGCGDEGPSCLASIGATLGANDVLRAVLKGTRQRARLELTLVRVKDAKPRGVEVELADLEEDVVEELRWHVAGLVGEKRPPPLGAIALVASGGALDGAELLLDDKRVAAPELKRVSPGEHRLEVRRSGFATVIWTGAVRPGRETRVPVLLERAEAVGARAGKPGASSAAASRSLAAGADETPALPGSAQRGAAAASSEGAESSSLTAPATRVEAEAGPRLRYTWFLAGGAAVATAVGVYFWARQQGLEAQLLDDCQGATVDGRLICRPGYQSCVDAPDRPECREGRTTETATWVAFPLAGALTGAAVAAFFLEDGPSALFGRSASGASGASGAMQARLPGLGASVLPLPGGLGAALGGRF